MKFKTIVWNGILLVFLYAEMFATVFGNARLAQAQSVPVTAGYRDFYFAKSVNGLLTGEKPQSKLWWNDGIWWGSLWNPSPKTYMIYRFDVATQSWTSTGTPIDNRTNAKADALWDGQRLYIVSQIYTNSPGPTTSENAGRLYRYSYNSAAKSYSLDAGFPVNVNSSTSETLVLAKDSTGKLWVTWTEGGKVKINRSLGNDLSWGTPFNLPTQGTDTKIDDISSIVAFGGNKIGVMWSNQNDKKSYFSIHLDGNADGAWEPKEVALADAALGAVSYDHINLKPSCDNNGNVYAATKTNLTHSGEPLVYLLKRNGAGVWTRYVVSTVDEDYVRPIVLIDAGNQKIYVFAMSEATGQRIIYMKSSNLSNIAFASGMGTPFIQSAADTAIMNPTSTKQCLNSATGLLVLAADQHTHYYLHNYFDLNGGTSQFTLTTNTIPQSGGGVALNPPGGVYNPGTVVTLTATPNSGFGFSGWSGYLSGSANPATITMDASKNVTATFTVQYTLTVSTTPQSGGSVTLDPPGGEYNPGTVVTLTATPNSGFQFSGWSGNLSGSTNPASITMNANKNVTATFTPRYTLTVNFAPQSGGSVALNPPGGEYNPGTVVTLTATPGSSFQFNSWSDDLSGSTNPATITMNANKNVTATFNQSGIVHEETQIGSSSNSTTATSANLSSASGHLYLAAIATRAKVIVNSVTGLGLTWTLVKAQCAGQNSTGIEVWKAQGTPSGNGAVTATFASAPANAVIAVSRYSGVGVSSVGNVVSGNTNGANGDCTGGANTNAYSLNLTTTVNGAIVYGAATMRGFTHSPGAGYTERAEMMHGSAGVQASVAVEDKSVATASMVALNGTFNGNVDWAVIGLEIKPSASVSQIVHEETKTGQSSNSTMVATSASLTGANGQLYLAAIATRGKVAVSSVTGLGLTWMLVKAQCAGQNSTGIEVWKAQGTPSGNGAVTANLASAPTNAVIAVSRYSGVAASPVGHVTSGNTNGASGVCTGGVNTNAYSFDLAASINGAIIYGAATMRGSTHTPGAGYTERAEILHGDAGVTTSVAIEDKRIMSASTVAVDGVFSGSIDWAMVGLEIKPQGAPPTQYTISVNTVGSGSVALDPLGGTYDAGTVVTVTSAPSSGFQFDGWSGDLSGSINPTTITMNNNKNVTATFSALPSGQIVHEETKTGGSANSTVVKTSGPLAGANGHLYLAAIAARPRVTVTGVSGLGLTWTLVKEQCAGRNTTEVEVWKAQGTPSGNDTVRATFAQTALTAVIAVSRYSGVAAVNPVGNVISGNTNGLYGACTGGVDTSFYTFNLTTTANGATIYGVATMRARTHTPGGGFAERAEISQDPPSNMASVAVEDKYVASASTAIVNGFFNGNVDWATVALEIKPGSPAKMRMISEENEATEKIRPVSGYALQQNYPNPFSPHGRGGIFNNPNTMIKFALPEAEKVMLKIYNETGQLVRTLVDDEMPAGDHQLRWNGRSQDGKILAAGLYLYQIVVQRPTGEVVFNQTKRMTLLK